MDKVVIQKRTYGLNGVYFKDVQHVRADSPAAIQMTLARRQENDPFGIYRVVSRSEDGEEDITEQYSDEAE